MRRWTAGGVVAAAVLCVVMAGSSQKPAVTPLDEKTLREYTGVYRSPSGFFYLQMWNEFTGFNKPRELVAFDEAGEIRTLYPTSRDQFFAGPGAAVSASVESRIEFLRDKSSRITSFAWRRDGAAPRVAQRVDVEKHEDVRFSSGPVQLAGTLITPASGDRHAAVVVVHGSGPEDREYVLPFARFLIRRGIAVLTYDKRGVGGSTGDWNTASFDDLASDVVAGFHYLKARPDIDPARIGLLGFSQAGWIMPLAAGRMPDLAFLISVSGAGVPPSETALDETQGDLTARGMKPENVAAVIDVMKLQYEFARTGTRWEDYIAAREQLATRLGRPPETFPATRDHPYWDVLRRTYLHDPSPVLRKLQAPVLALFGELDTNILPDKNKAAWEVALKAGGHKDFTLVIVPKANHLMLEANAGTKAEMASLRRFAPDYFTTVHDWLAKRIGIRVRE